MSDAHKTGRPPLVLHEHFDANVFPVTESGCWIWMGSVTLSGYGRLGTGPTHQRAHRYAFKRFNGPIRDGMMVCHRCDIRCCVNPDHLFLGTGAENQHDMVSKGRSLAGSKNHQAKLSPEIVREIRASTLWDSALARRFGVHPTTIRNVLAGRAWMDAP